MKKSVKKNNIVKKALVVGMTLAISTSLFTGCGGTSADKSKNVLSNEAAIINAFDNVAKLNVNKEVLSQSAELDGSNYKVTVITEDSVNQYTVDSSLAITSEQEITNTSSATDSSVADDSITSSSTEVADSSTIDSSSAGTEVTPSETEVSTFEKVYNEAVKLTGLKVEDILSFDFDKDTYMGQASYEVEIKTANAKYEYIFNAKDMTILESEIKLKNATSESTSYIEESQAITIALSTVGVTDQAEVTNFRIMGNKSSGTRFYKIKFTYGDYNYEVKVNAVDGVIQKFEKEISKSVILSSAVENAITQADAEKIALDFIATEGALVKKTKIDYEKGKFVYEIEATVGELEYEIEIDAASGEILDCEIETEGNDDDRDDHNGHYDDDDRDDHNGHKDDDDIKVEPNYDSFISIEQAKDAVLAKLTGTQIFVTSIEVDRNDKTGEFVYEVTVKVDGVKKEFEVSAIDATIVNEVIDDDDDFGGNHGQKPMFTPEISEQEALQIALDKYTVNKNEAKISKVEFDESNGKYVIKYKVNDIEYNFEINGDNGKIEGHQKRFD